jgi:hypothetical protein
MSRNVPLTELDGDVTRIEGMAAGTKAVLFLCPVCYDHYHLVTFEPGNPQHGTINNQHRWGHINGSTVEDITLVPSYVATTQDCRLHCFIRNGVVEVLGDSKYTGSKEINK